jgi:hypothetical protein
MPSGFISDAALIAGFPAEVFDTLASRFLPKYLITMSPAQRAEVEAASAVIGKAARASREHRAASSVDGQSAPERSELAEDLTHDHEVNTEMAAVMLRVGQRQVRKLAAGWRHEGLARQVGRTWLIDRGVVAAYRDRQGRRAAA